MTASGRPWLVSIAYTDLPSDPRVIRAAREAARRGARTALLVPRAPGGENGFSIDGVEIAWLPIDQERGHTTIRGQLRFMSSIRRWAREQTIRPDVVHVNNMPDYLYWAVRDWHVQGARVVLDVHDVMSDLARHRFPGPKGRLAAIALGRLERSAWKRVDHLITVHDTYRDAITAAGIAQDKVSVVLNAPDPDDCNPSMRRPPSSQGFKIVFHGTVSARTGVIHAIRALPRVLREVPDARMLIIGGGNGAGDVRAAIKELDLGARIEFVDHFIPVPDVIEAIADAHAAVVPNERSAFTEGILPVKLLEYVTLRIPVVATRLPLIERYVGETCAHLVPEPRPDLIAAGLIRLARDKTYRDHLAETSRDFYARHSWHHYSDVLTEALFAGMQLSTTRVTVGRKEADSL